MVDAASRDLLAQYDDFCRAEQGRLAAEAEELRQRLGEVEIELAQIPGSRAVFMRFVARMRDSGRPFGEEAPSRLAEEAAQELGAKGDDPAAPPSARENDEREPGMSTPPSSAPDGEPSVLLATERDRPLSVRIASIMHADPRRSWNTRDLAALLYDDPVDRSDRTKRETVRKTLERMVVREHVARDDGSYTPTEKIGDALRLAKRGHVAPDGTPPTQITGEALPIAN